MTTPKNNQKTETNYITNRCIRFSVTLFSPTLLGASPFYQELSRELQLTLHK